MTADRPPPSKGVFDQIVEAERIKSRSAPHAGLGLEIISLALMVVASAALMGSV